MQKRPWEISDLLALRDGEPHAAELDAQDPAVAPQLEQLNQLQAELNALPDVPVDDAVWERLLPPQSHRQSAWLRFPLATAASVFFASVLGIYLLFGNAGPAPVGFEQGGGLAGDPAAVMSMDPSGLQLAGLMRQSRDLEQRLYGHNPLSTAADNGVQTSSAQNTPSPAEQMLLFRLADVDAQIARLYEAERMDPQRREALWAQRVNVLQSLVALRGGSDPRMFEDLRSM